MTFTPPHLIQRLIDRWDDWRARRRPIDQIALQRSIRNHPAKGRRS